jgi:putative transcriptional regulator
MAKRRVFVKNPLHDPIGHVKQPLNRKLPGRPVIEFEPHDIAMIRSRFLGTQRDFARMIGIKLETLRNWETGRRRPHGPARALLRAIDADPFLMARLLNARARDVKDEPDEWLDMDEYY